MTNTIRSSPLDRQAFNAVTSDEPPKTQGLAARQVAVPDAHDKRIARQREILNHSRLQTPAPGVRSGKSAAALAGPPRREPPRRPSLAPERDVHAEMRRSAALDLARAAAAATRAESPAAPRTDDEALDAVLGHVQAARGGDAAALKDLAQLLASHRFDFSRMSAAQLAMLHAQVESVRKPMYDSGALEAALPALQAIHAAFNDRLVDTDQTEAFESLARDARSADPEARSALAAAVAKLPARSAAKLFLEMQKFPEELRKPQDPLVVAVKKAVLKMDVGTFQLLESEFPSMSVEGQKTLQALLLPNKSSLLLQLAKESLNPIAAGLKATSPESVSDGVGTLRGIQSGFDRMTGRNPSASRSAQRAELETLIKDAARQSPNLGVTGMVSVLNGTKATLVRNKPVFTPQKNAVSEVVNSIVPAATEKSRTQADNIQLLARSLRAALKTDR